MKLVIWLRKYLSKLSKVWPCFSYPFMVKCKERNDIKTKLLVKRETDWKIGKIFGFFLLKGTRKLVQERTQDCSQI